MVNRWKWRIARSRMWRGLRKTLGPRGCRIWGHDWRVEKVVFGTALSDRLIIWRPKLHEGCIYCGHKNIRPGL